MNATNAQTEVIVSVPLAKIVANRYQPRTSMDPAELQTLAESIQRNGLMQKPTARLQEDGCHELAFGHRRFEAYRLLAAQDPAYKSMPLIVRDLTNEQMFEFAWEENREREDLNPVDQGEAYIIYMREFGKTSKQAGEYFHVSEETIRQKSRYLKLPEPIKEKMRAGEVNENTARGLLTMQKIAPENVLVETVKVIEKNRENATPEEVIDDSIGRLKDVVDMWDEGRKDGKPRSAWSNGWLLDMKNFPNHLLPAMTVEAVGFHEKNIDHLVNPPACTACPFHVKVRGSHYCGLKVCYERKTAAWYRLTIQQASKDLGIPIYDKEDGRYVALDSYDHRALFNSKHKGLRLILTSQAGKKYQYFSGIESDVALVVATGEAISKLSKGSKVVGGGKKSEAEKAEMRMKRVYRMRRKELLWEFTAVAKTIFDGVPVEAVKEIKRWKFVGVDDAIPDEWLKGKKATADIEADFERRELIWRMIDDVCSHYTRSSMKTILGKLQKQAGEWGIKIPARITKLAEQFDAEIEAAAEKRAK